MKKKNNVKYCNKPFFLVCFVIISHLIPTIKKEVTLIDIFHIREGSLEVVAEKESIDQPYYMTLIPFCCITQIYKYILSLFLYKGLVSKENRLFQSLFPESN